MWNGLLYWNQILFQTKTHSNICRQIQLAKEILVGISIDPSRLTLNRSEYLNRDDLSHVTHSLLSNQQRAHFAGIEDKRRLIQMAVETLQSAATNPPEWIAFSQAAPFGEILVNPDSCTLCMACVQICPKGALLDNQERPQLKLIEANCVQCGLCREACPEEAHHPGSTISIGSKCGAVCNSATRGESFCLYKLWKTICL